MLPAMRLPPSIRIETISLSLKTPIRNIKSIPFLCSGIFSIIIPLDSKVFCFAGSISAQAINVDPPSFTSFASIGIRPFVSITTRNGCISKLSSFSVLAVNSGLSARTVSIPTITAPDMYLILCTTFLDCSPEIHLDLPLEVAILPSALIAYFSVIKGSPVTICFA